MRVSIVVLSSALCLAGCNSAEGEGVVRETLPNGSELVRNEGPGQWGAAGPLEAVLVTRIGSADGTDPTKLFSAIVDIQVDEQDRLWILDQQSDDIRVFDSSGQFVRRVGSSGEGPGELRNPIGLAWSPEGHLWVANVGNARYEVFDTSGAYVGSHPRLVGTYGVPWGGRFDSSGSLAEPLHYRDPVADESKTGMLVQAVGSEPWTADTFAIPSFEATYWRVENQRGTMTMGIPFAPVLRWSFDGANGIWLGTTDRYRLVRTNFTGDTALTVERTASRLPVTSEDIDGALERFEERFPDVRTRVDLNLIPDSKPAFDNFVLDDQGRVWVMQTRESNQVLGGASTTFDVFEPDGRLLGSITAGIGSFPPPRIVRGKLVGVLRDDFEVPYVVVYAIQH